LGPDVPLTGGLSAHRERGKERKHEKSEAKPEAKPRLLGKWGNCHSDQQVYGTGALSPLQDSHSTIRSVVKRRKDKMGGGSKVDKGKVK